MSNTLPTPLAPLDDTSHGAIVAAANGIKAKLDRLIEAAKNRRSSRELDELYRALSPEDVKPIQESIAAIADDELSALEQQEEQARREFLTAQRQRNLHQRFHCQGQAAEAPAQLPN